MYIKENVLLAIISGKLNLYEVKLVMLFCVIESRTNDDKVLNLNSLDSLKLLLGHNISTIEKALISLQAKNILKIKGNSIYMIDADYWDLD